MDKTATVFTEKDALFIRWRVSDAIEYTDHLTQLNDDPDIAYATYRVTELIESGYEINDPKHWLDILGILTDPYQSLSALDADSAGYTYLPMESCYNLYDLRKESQL